ncbi:PREDICTED: NKG2D ligand 1-like [Chrysochloris asiatica]|uniref:NKG2D ligand 1-like n=1 Tax=Chrysochloris asiatica TaxID=185453 RepID=A0A9B0TXH2_CHRAS|nr:PREDICTED: NKG2D ligand 1-like [Chrysochloris asiatica]
MALNPGTRLLCFSLLLLGGHTQTKKADPHSLCYNFTIMLKSPPGQPWCEVQGQVDGRTFLHCDCGTNRDISLSPLGMKINATKEWEQQIQTLKDMGDELKQLLPGIELQKDTPRAPLPLQAKMCCQQEAGRCTGASWQFGFGGQMFLLYDSENMKWTEVHPGGRQMREEWEKDTDATKFFRRTSEGDCNHWLRTFWGHWEKMLEPAEQPPMTPGSAQSKATAITPSPWILLVTLTCSILLVIQGFLL